MSKRIGCVILSRMDSKRLPCKALKTLGDKPLVHWPIDAITSLNKKISVILATSDRKIDSILENVAHEKNIDFFAGPLNNVSKRIATAASAFNLDFVFRINGDSPFISTELFGEAIDIIEQQNVDFVSNLYNRTYPYGVSCELIKVSTFKNLLAEFDEYEAEHATSYYYKNNSIIKYAEISQLENNYSDLRWTVDTATDLEKLNSYLNKTKIKKINLQPIRKVVEDYKLIMS